MDPRMMTKPRQKRRKRYRMKLYLREWRLVRRMSQRDVCRLTLTINQPILSQYECGHRVPFRRTLKIMADVLELPNADLLYADPWVEIEKLFPRHERWRRAWNGKSRSIGARGPFPRSRRRSGGTRNEQAEG